MPPHPPSEHSRRRAADPEPAAAELDAGAVSAYLRSHPDFLQLHPDLVPLLSLPARDLGDGVVDLQKVMLERLRSEVARLKLVQRKLISTSRSNMASQARVHAAALALIGSTSFEQLIAVVTDEMTMLLDIDAVGLCVETTQGASSRLDASGHPVGAIGVQVLAHGSVEELIGPGRDVLLRQDVVGDPGIYGAAAASLVRSDALVKLRVSSAAPIGLLALGSRRTGTFNPRQGTELLTFLAHVIEHSIRAWLDLPE